jgi:hypothetical protein
MEPPNLLSGPPKDVSELMNMIYSSAALGYMPALLSLQDIDSALDVLFDKPAMNIYVKLQSLEEAATAAAAKHNLTYEHEAGKRLLDLRVLGSWFIVLHSGFCRVALSSTSREELKRDVDLALAKEDSGELLNIIGENLRSVVLMCASSCFHDPRYA